MAVTTQKKSGEIIMHHWAKWHGPRLLSASAPCRFLRYCVKTAYTEIQLHCACKIIHQGNQVRRNWWQCMEHMIQATLSEHNQTHAETIAPPHSTLSLKNVAEHDSNMGNDTRTIHHMPGATFEQKWLNYIHRSNYDNRSSHTSGRACSWEGLVPSL